MTKTIHDTIAEARAAATTLIERRQSAALPSLEEMQTFGEALGELIATTERLEQALRLAIPTLAASRHLIGKYTPDHHWLPEHDLRVAGLKTALGDAE